MLIEATVNENIKICSDCGSTERYHAKGLCRRCYNNQLLYDRSINSPLKKCECKPECQEMIHSISLSGLPAKFKKGHYPKGPLHKNFIGRYYDDDGYVLIYKPEHPNSDSKGYVREHIDVFTTYYGCCMIKGGEVHHENEIKDDNRIENLRGMTHSQHRRLHMIGNKIASKKNQSNGLQ